MHMCAVWGDFWRAISASRRLVDSQQQRRPAASGGSSATVYTETKRGSVPGRQAANGREVFEIDGPDLAKQ